MLTIIIKSVRRAANRSLPLCLAGLGLGWLAVAAHGAEQIEHQSLDDKPAATIDVREIEVRETVQPSDTSRQSKAQTLPEQGLDPNWLDHGQLYIANSSDEMAEWLDHFFGVRSSDLESADSTLRLIIDNDWEEYEGVSTDVRLRGKVHLPRIDERLSLVITDEDDDERALEDELPSDEEREKSTNIGLQYKARDEDRSRLDYKVGLSSKVKFKANARYRYKWPWGDKLVNRFSENLYFIDQEGFGSKTKLENDWLFNDKKLLRLSNNIKFAEDIDGVEWSSQLALNRRVNRHAALSQFIWASGETRPDYLTTAYGLGVRYRKNFYRKWLYYELEPAYAWKRSEVEDERKGVWLFKLRLEMVFER